MWPLYILFCCSFQILVPNVDLPELANNVTVVCPPCEELCWVRKYVCACMCVCVRVCVCVCVCVCVRARYYKCIGPNLCRIILKSAVLLLNPPPLTRSCPQPLKQHQLQQLVLRLPPNQLCQVTQSYPQPLKLHQLQQLVRLPPNQLCQVTQSCPQPLKHHQLHLLVQHLLPSQVRVYIYVLVLQINVLSLYDCCVCVRVVMVLCTSSGSLQLLLFSVLLIGHSL